jgi:hypothetical protein
MHDGGAHLAATLKRESEGGAKVLSDIFGVGAGITGAGRTLCYTGTGIATGKVTVDEHGRLHVDTAEASHGGMRMPVNGGYTPFELQVIAELYAMAGEGLLAEYSPTGSVSPDVILSSRGLLPLAIAVARAMGTTLPAGMLPEHVNAPEVLDVILGGEDSRDPRVVATRLWLDWQGDFCNGLVSADNAYARLVLGGLFAKLGVDVIRASGFRRRLCAGEFAEKIRCTPVDVLVDKRSGIKGIFTEMDLAA